MKKAELKEKYYELSDAYQRLRMLQQNTMEQLDKLVREKLASTVDILKVRQWDYAMDCIQVMEDRAPGQTMTATQVRGLLTTPTPPGWTPNFPVVARNEE